MREALALEVIIEERRASVDAVTHTYIAAEPISSIYVSEAGGLIG